MRRPATTSRRQFLRAAAAVPAVLAQGAARPARGQGPLPPTPTCTEPGDVTPPQTEGPFFRATSPRRASLLEPGMGGVRLTLTGRVLGTDCQPVAGALLDFWQADDRGGYDAQGYRLRGHQLTDEQGRYRLLTIVPAAYPGRTRHIHVKVQAPHQRVVTTQLYWPGEPQNARDFLFRPELQMRVETAPDGQRAAFDFVVDARRVRAAFAP